MSLGYILWTLQKEMVKFITERHKFLTSPAHAASAQANTVLITGIPLRYLNDAALKKLFGVLPGGVAKVCGLARVSRMPLIRVT
jgi:calcium permeable stress-gated cation channel